MSPDKKDALFLSQFPYCPLTWIFHDRELNYKIDKLHERCLRLVHHGTTYSFKELLQKQFCLKTPQVLATGMFGVYKGISPNIMTEDSPLSYPLNYDLKHQK